MRKLVRRPNLPPAGQDPRCGLKFSWDAGAIQVLDQGRGYGRGDLGSARADRLIRHGEGCGIRRPGSRLALPRAPQRAKLKAPPNPGAIAVPAGLNGRQAIH